VELRPFLSDCRLANRESLSIPLGLKIAVSIGLVVLIALIIDIDS